MTALSISRYCVS